MSANPVTNAGLVRKALRMPDFREYEVKFSAPGTAMVQNTEILGGFLRDIMRNNMKR